MVLIPVVAVLLLATTSSPAQAQAVVDSGALSSLTVPRSGSNIAPTSPHQGVGGGTFGITIGGGWIGDWGALVEASIPKYLSFHQTSNMFERSGRLRDITVGTFVHRSPATGGNCRWRKPRSAKSGQPKHTPWKNAKCVRPHATTRKEPSRRHGRNWYRSAAISTYLSRPATTRAYHQSRR